jgi:hypothetical protein
VLEEKELRGIRIIAMRTDTKGFMFRILPPSHITIVNLSRRMRRSNQTSNVASNVALSLFAIYK